ncbi:MAG: sxtJ [Gammaproteobacteria bacterium]|nr:sxtJ [Gammaproteobacteria bacterium]
MHETPELDDRGLRNFAFTTASTIVVLFALVFPWLFSLEWPLWPWILSVILIFWGILAPQSLEPVYKNWMRFGLLISRITTPIILGVLFYLVLTPVALIMKILGKETIQLRIDKNRESYRVPGKVRDKNDLEKPF